MWVFSWRARNGKPVFGIFAVIQISLGNRQLAQGSKSEIVVTQHYRYSRNVLYPTCHTLCNSESENRPFAANIQVGRFFRWQNATTSIIIRKRASFSHGVTDQNFFQKSFFDLSPLSPLDLMALSKKALLIRYANTLFCGWSVYLHYQTRHQKLIFVLILINFFVREVWFS